MPTVDIDSLWNKIHGRNKNHTPREITIDDSVEESTDEEFENEDEVEIGEDIISDEEDNEVDVESKSVMNSFLSDKKECLGKELSKASTMIDECSEDKFSLVECLHDHNFWIRSEAIHHACKKINHQMDLIGCYRDLRVWLPDVQCGVNPPCPMCASTNRI